MPILPTVKPTLIALLHRLQDGERVRSDELIPFLLKILAYVDQYEDCGACTIPDQRKGASPLER